MHPPHLRNADNRYAAESNRANYTVPSPAKKLVGCQNVFWQVRSIWHIGFGRMDLQGRLLPIFKNPDRNLWPRITEFDNDFSRKVLKGRDQEKIDLQNNKPQERFLCCTGRMDVTPRHVQIIERQSDLNHDGQFGLQEWKPRPGLQHTFVYVRVDHKRQRHHQKWDWDQWRGQCPGLATETSCVKLHNFAGKYNPNEY